MLTQEDYELLKPLQIKQLLLYLPTLNCFDIEILGQSIILSTDDSEVCDRFQGEAVKVLRVASVVCGSLYLLMRCGGRLHHKEELGLKKTCESNRAMTAMFTEEKQDLIFTQESNPATTLISWQTTAHHLGIDEVALRQQCAEQGVGFGWMPDGGSWGIEQEAAKRLVMSYYVNKAQATIKSMESGEAPQAETNGAKPRQTATAEPKPKGEKKKSDKPPIEFKIDFKPVKTARISAERYLEALAPGDKETQFKYVADIVTNKVEAQRHLSKAIAHYKLSKVENDSHTRAQLQTAFVNLYEKMKKSESNEAS